MRKHFIDLIKYNEWANQRVLISIEKLPEPSEKLILLFGHLISAQIIWLNRIKELPTSPFPLWTDYKLRELRTMTEESTTNWLNYLNQHRMDTFEEMIFYKNSMDKKHENTIREIVTHVINHSTYHRGQIAMELRGLGVEPPQTDYIAYCRTR